VFAVSQTEHCDIDEHDTQFVGEHSTQGKVGSVLLMNIFYVLLQNEQVLLALR
jgi:hypothetical protein